MGELLANASILQRSRFFHSKLGGAYAWSRLLYALLAKSHGWTVPLHTMRLKITSQFKIIRREAACGTAPSPACGPGSHLLAVGLAREPEGCGCAHASSRYGGRRLRAEGGDRRPGHLHDSRALPLLVKIAHQ